MGHPMHEKWHYKQTPFRRGESSSSVTGPNDIHIYVHKMKMYTYKYLQTMLITFHHIYIYISWIYQVDLLSMLFPCLRPVGARKAFLFGRAPVTVKRMPRKWPKGPTHTIAMSATPDVSGSSLHRVQSVTHVCVFRSLADSVPTPSSTAGTVITFAYPTALPIVSTVVNLNWRPNISHMKKALKAGMLRNWFSL